MAMHLIRNIRYVNREKEKKKNYKWRLDKCQKWNTINSMRRDTKKKKKHKRETVPIIQDSYIQIQITDMHSVDIYIFEISKCYIRQRNMFCFYGYFIIEWTHVANCKVYHLICTDQTPNSVYDLWLYDFIVLLFFFLLFFFNFILTSTKISCFSLWSHKHIITQVTMKPLHSTRVNLFAHKQ